jgi:hypothetical protein
MRLPSPFTIVFLVAAICAALLESEDGVFLLAGVALFIEAVIFMLAGRDGLG